MANQMYCPKCGKVLVELANGKQYCRSCQMQYVVTSKAGAQTKEKSSAPLVALLLLLILLLGGVGGFAAYHYFFGNSYTKYIQKEYMAYQAAGSPASLMSTDEAAAQKGMSEGDPVAVMGIVEGVEDNLVSLNNGVDCYIIPEALSSTDADKLGPALNAIHPGDVVGMNGMLCDTDPFTLKYCGLPYQYYDGERFYTEYEEFRRTGTYPDITFDAEIFNGFIELVNAGDILYQTAPDVLNAFRARGGVTADSFARGADLYRDRALSLSGTVTGIGNNYINIEGIYCFYFFDLLIDVDIEIINSITINDYVTVMGLVTNPSVDAFRMSYCTVTERVPTEEQNRPEPSGTSTISDALRQVLLRETQFINEEGEYCSSDVFSDGWSTFETASFAIVDMNGDGKTEAVLRSTPLSDIAGDYMYMVLYEYNDTVYGKSISISCKASGLQIGGLQTNGLFWSPTGGAGSGFLQRCEINGNQCEVITEAMMFEEWRYAAYMDETYTPYSDSVDDEYTIRGQDATKEEFYDYLDQVGWKEDGSMEAVFHDYTTENILALLTA